MRHWYWGLLALASLLLSACGGGGSTGEEVTVSLVVPMGSGGPTAAEVVYQAGDGDWQLATQKGFGEYVFTLPPGEKRYGVAVACYPYGLALGSVGWARVYQLTTDEATALKVSCFDLQLGDLSFTEVEAEARAKPGDGGYDRAWYYTGIADRQVGFGSGARLEVEAKPDRDLLVVAYDDGTSDWRPDLIRRIRFVRDLDASDPPLPRYEVELGPEDQPEAVAVSAFTPPTWADGGSSFGVGFVSAQGLMVPHTSGDPNDNPALGAGDAAGGSYYRVPDAGEGDVYYAEATAWDAGGTYFVSQVKILGPEGPEVAFELPQEKFDPGVDGAALPTFNGLDYGGDDLVGYAFFAMFTAFGEEVVVSSGWLGSADSYTLPDLTGVPGFQGAKPLKGEDVLWRATAVMSETPLGEILSGDPLPVPNPAPRTPGVAFGLASKTGLYPAP